MLYRLNHACSKTFLWSCWSIDHRLALASLIRAAVPEKQLIELSFSFQVGGEIDTLAERDRRSTDDHFTEEILAQAMCQAYAFQKDLRGRVYAVGRQCPSTSNCRTICESPYLHVQDGQTAHSTWSCIKAFHVYYGRPTTNKSGQQSNAVLGLKSLSFGADDYCDETRCGPNFCCCFALEVDRTVWTCKWNYE